MVRTSTSPAAGSGNAISTNSKSPSTGIPRGLHRARTCVVVCAAAMDAVADGLVQSAVEVM